MGFLQPELPDRKGNGRVLKKASSPRLWRWADTRRDGELEATKTPEGNKIGATIIENQHWDDKELWVTTTAKWDYDDSEVNVMMSEKLQQEMELHWHRAGRDSEGQLS